MDYETVTLKIPKPLMKFLKEHEDMLGEKVEDYLACCVVGSVRADLETKDVFVASPLETAKKYNLQTIFKVFDVGIFDPSDTKASIEAK